MTQTVPLSLGAYKRSLSPEAILLNAYQEKAPTQQSSPVAIRSRAGQAAFKTVGAGPSRALFTKAGLFDGSAIVVSGTAVYTLDPTGATTLFTGSVAGQDIVDIDAGQDSDLNPRLWIATGTALYKGLAGAIAEDDFPDADRGGATSVCEHRGFVFAVKAGSDQVFVLIPGDVTWQPLSFVSAEYSPDKLKGVRSRGDQFVLLGSDTCEVWTLDGTADPPMAPYGGLNTDFGCRSIATAVNVVGSLIFVDSRCGVRIFEGGAFDLISDNGLTEQIQAVAAEDISASWRTEGGHLLYQLNLGSVATWVYDLTTQAWHRESSLGYDYLRTRLYAPMGDLVLGADSITPAIRLVDAAYRDDSDTPYPVEFTAFLELLEGTVTCANIELVAEVGNAPLAGQGSNPVIQMRYSDDGGKTFSGWKERPLGQTGQYLTRVKWNALGQISAPFGRIFHFRVSDPVGRRFSSLVMNAS